jgi:hypothetical protein
MRWTKRLLAKALAAATGTDPDALNRAIRLLCAHGIFEQQADGYGHTPASRLLRSDHPQSIRSFVRMQGIPALWHIWEHFDHSLRTGRSAAEKTLPNGGFWGYFADNPEQSRLFNDAMTAKTHAQIAGILPAYDFSHFHSVADIGGGNGHLLRAIRSCPPPDPGFGCWPNPEFLALGRGSDGKTYLFSGNATRFAVTRGFGVKRTGARRRKPMCR